MTFSVYKSVWDRFWDFGIEADEISKCSRYLDNGMVIVTNSQNTQWIASTDGMKFSDALELVNQPQP